MNTKNKLAGTKTGKSKSAKYFQSHPEARKKKNEYNKDYHSTPERKQYRAELNKINRQKGKVGDGKDVSHTKSGTTMERQSSNRARNGKDGNSTLK